jgi:hypothetical protein
MYRILFDLGLGWELLATVATADLAMRIVAHVRVDAKGEKLKVVRV